MLNIVLFALWYACSRALDKLWKDSNGLQVIQRRGDFGEPRENFTRSWEEYKMGFGDLEQEFWWGNDKISRLTKERPMVLKVVLEAHDGRVAIADYDTFR